ncbi:unnamed protein product [Effrenium voratum]|uniref:Uncharacterized protein n=1 Tax=Effrenium voratum TaxID=2562239 RepID=A0AA36JI47_9DINO|nr:unnamed protein product [Effrenium voratum]
MATDTEEDELVRRAVAECPAAMRLLYRLEVRLDAERQELSRQIQSLERDVRAASIKEPQRERLICEARDAAEWSELSGRLDALNSVLANHGARLLEGEANLQAVMEHAGWQAEELSFSPHRALPERSRPDDQSERRTPSGAKHAELEALRDGVDDMRQQLEELQHQRTSTSTSAAMGDMKALWREVSKLQASQCTLSTCVQETSGELPKLKQQLELLQNLVLTYKDALSDMTQRLKGSLRGPEALASEPVTGPLCLAAPSLAAHARRHATVDRSWQPGSHSLKKLVENVLQFVEELHSRVRSVEETSSLNELADLKRQVDILQGETLMSFHQLQQAVADLNCHRVQDVQTPGRGSSSEAALQQLTVRVGRLEALGPAQPRVDRLEDQCLRLSNRIERLEASWQPEKPTLEASVRGEPNRSGEEADWLRQLVIRLECLEAIMPEKLGRSGQEAAMIQQLVPRVERLEATPVQLDRINREVALFQQLVDRVEHLEEAEGAVAGVDHKVASLQQLVNRVEQLEASPPQQLDRVSQEAGSLQQLVNRMELIEASAPQQLDRLSQEAASLQQLVNRVERLEASGPQQLDRVSQEVASLQQLVNRVERLEAGGPQQLDQQAASLQQLVNRVELLEASGPQQLDRVSQEASSLQQLVNRIERLEASISDLLERSAQEASSQQLLGRVERLEANGSRQLDRIEEEAVSLQKLVGRMEGLEGHVLQRLDQLEATEAEVELRVERLEATVAELSKESRGLRSAIDTAHEHTSLEFQDAMQKLESDQARLHARLEDLEEPVLRQMVEETAEKALKESVATFTQLQGDFSALQQSLAQQSGEAHQRGAQTETQLASVRQETSANTAKCRELSESLSRLQKMLPPQTQLEELADGRERLSKDLQKLQEQLLAKESELAKRSEGKADAAELQRLELRIAHCSTELREELLDRARLSKDVQKLEQELLAKEAELTKRSEGKADAAELQRLEQRLTFCGAEVHEAATRKELQRTSNELVVLQSKLEQLREEGSRQGQLTSELLEAQGMKQQDHALQEELQALRKAQSALDAKLAGLEPEARRIERVPHALQNLQESMTAIKSELVQVQNLAGVHQPGDSPPRAKVQAPASAREPSARARLGDLLFEPLTAAPRVTDIAHLAEELQKARAASVHQTRMEVHRAEALGALESKVSAVTLRLEDACARIHEAELGLDAASRGGLALRLRLEQLQSSVELRLTSLAGDLADVTLRQQAMERGLPQARDRSAQLARPSHAAEEDLWERFRRKAP